MGSSTGQRGGRGRLAVGLTAAGVLVSMVGVGCGTVASESARTPAARASGSPAAAGAQLWARTYYPAGFTDAVAASPDGSAVFVTGAIRKNGVAYYATIGYHAGTGRQVWLSRFNIGGPYGAPDAIAVSPDGGTVFVVGQGSGSGAGYATIAYNASTGRQLWVSRYKWVARALVMSPDGRTVYVTGYAFSSNLGYVTIAYNAATGARRWLARYNGPANGNDQARSVAISPNGKSVYVTGRSYGGTSRYDYATVAYNALTGAQRWASRYDGRANGNDFSSGVVVAPGGESVYVTGGSQNSTTRTANPSAHNDFATVAYNAATGAQRWVARYNDKYNGADEGGSVAITPDGRTVVVAGPSFGNRTGYAAVAYNAATGAALWTRRVLGFPVAVPLGTQTLAVSPDSRTVYVAGPSPCGFCDYHYRTVAFAVATGTQEWMSTYNGPGKGDDNPIAVALSPDGRTLYVTGSTTGAATWGFTTIAYRT